MGLSGGEGLLIALIATLFFGGKKLPELGKTFGASRRNFKEGLKEEDNQTDKDKKEIDDKNKKA
jgi:sec-independent protein translocase protein TatA